MSLLDVKEKIGRIRFFIDKVKYKRGRHFYLTVFGLLFLIVTLFTAVFINQKVEIKRKENILKSYYSENNTGASKLNETTSHPDEIKIIADDGKEEYPEPGNLEDIKNSNDTEGLPQNENTIKAYICGEVKNPGVYEIEDGARIVDLLELAGGCDENACLEIVNLAQTVVDGQRIYIPSQEEISGGSSLFFVSNYLNDYKSSESRTININTANLEELELLSGIGPVIAQNIIEYRNKNRLFKMKEELKNVTGIGDKKYEEIKQHVSI